jgi:hypothetical protein
VGGGGVGTSRPASLWVLSYESDLVNHGFANIDTQLIFSNNCAQNSARQISSEFHQN